MHIRSPPPFLLSVQSSPAWACTRSAVLARPPAGAAAWNGPRAGARALTRAEVLQPAALPARSGSAAPMAHGLRPLLQRAPRASQLSF